MKYSPNPREEIFDLISEHEMMSKIGVSTLLDERDFEKLISYFEKESHYSKALDLIEIALGNFPYSVEFYRRKANLLLTLERYDDAEACINQVLALAPLDLQACILKVRYFAAIEQFDEALDLIEDLSNQDFHKNLIPLWMVKAEVFMQIGEFDGAVEVLQMILDADPVNREALELYWLCIESDKDWEKSAKFHKYLIDRFPYNAGAWYNLGLSYSCMGEYDMAIDAFEYAFIIDENFDAAYRDCADLCFELGRYRKALKIYLETLEVFGSDSDLYSNIGQCLIHLNKNKIARKYLTKALQLDPYNDELHYYVGISFSREGRWVNAINAYHRALDLDDMREEYYAGLGEAYFHLNEFKKADKYFKKAIKDGPEQSFIWIAYATFLIATDQVQKAIEMLYTAESYAQSSDVLYCKSACYFLLGNKVQGLETLKEALVSDYSLHGLLFTFAPYLQFDSDIQSIISYFKEQ